MAIVTSRQLAGAVAVVVLLSIVFFSGVFSPKNTVTFHLTDPPHVPVGTQSLVITYSSVQAHLTGQGNSSGWTFAGGSGTLDLLAVVNSSFVMGSASIPLNSSINLFRFNITSAKIKINNTTYNVTVPNQRVVAHVFGNTGLNKTSKVLVQMSPVVATIFTANATIFVMVPSLRAVVVPTASNAPSQVGAINKLSKVEEDALNETEPNITISAASISVLGNTTKISVTVADSSNRSVILRHLNLFGNLSVKFNNSAILSSRQAVLANIANVLRSQSICTNTTIVNSVISNITSNIQHNNVHQRIQPMDRNGTASKVASGDRQGANMTNSFFGSGISGISGTSVGNHSVSGSNFGNHTTVLLRNVSESEDEFHLHNSTNGSEFESHDFGGFKTKLNSSLCNREKLNEMADKLQEQVQEFSQRMQEREREFRMMPLMIAANGSLFVPSGEESFHNQSGFTIKPGQSFTFTFKGQIQSAGGHTIIVPNAGSQYTIGVSGEEDAHASASVKAVSG